MNSPNQNANPGPARAPTRPEVRERRRTRGLNDDRFAIDLSKIPDGETYEWKRMSLFGKEDPYYIQTQRENGWEPVQADRHPELVPEGYDASRGGKFKGAIIKDGMILMERPKVLTLEAEAEMYQAATGQVLAQEQLLGSAPEGTLPRTAHPQTKPSVTRNYASTPIE